MPEFNLKTIINYSPNFDPIKRKFRDIKFIIFHYTGMKNEKHATRRLTDLKSKVSSHYLIKNDGKIVVLVPDLYIAWHAGVSSWKKYKFLNKNSIGIEISNPGHNFNYKKFSNKQVNSILVLSKFLINKYNIKPENILGHSDIAPDRKKDPGEKFPWEYLYKNKIGYWYDLDQKVLLKKRVQKTSAKEKKIFIRNLNKIGYSKNLKINQNKYLKIITKAFQRRFRQTIINGIVDKECLIISDNLIKKTNNKIA
tara:strand:- start:106 stop:864 length:759 start_codon:yes stop_codon:yes gene_type:complete